MMDVGEWQGRLEKHFSVNGVIGEPLLGIIKQEQQYGIFVENTFHGQNILMALNA